MTAVVLDGDVERVRQFPAGCSMPRDTDCQLPVTLPVVAIFENSACVTTPAAWLVTARPMYTLATSGTVCGFHGLAIHLSVLHWRHSRR